jgi:ferredoxin
VDDRYAARRAGTFVLAVDCGAPASTCFCSSMGTGPAAGPGYDLALTELTDERHRFHVRIGSPAGAEVLASVPREPVGDGDVAERLAVLDAARAGMGRTLDTDGLPGLIEDNIDHPRWDEVAERCLSCGNCTLVCPTCFCSDVDDVTDLSGSVERQRRWASCFDMEHSFLHSGPVRTSTSSRYRQWLTHKLSTWWDQFDGSGCVGCGRCITWCPVGIDLTEEVAAIRAGDRETVGGDAS